ncbi:MAG: GTP-binding protein [Myxococcota bacterium]
MAKVVAESAEVNARIVYWGVDGAGKRSCLQAVRAKLRPDHRGDLSELPTRFDPSVTYPVLPIELGDIGGMRTRIELVAVPGEPSQAPTRKQLLDQVDGIVLVIDAQQSRIEENAALVDELRKSLADYARELSDLPLVVQYNKRDLSDAYVIDELHRRLELGNATVFETVASETTGVLQALSTISKKVIRALRDSSLGAHNRPAAPQPAAPSEPAAAPAPAPAPQPATQPRAAAEPEPLVSEPEPLREPRRGLESLPAEPALEVAPAEAAAQLEEAILAEAEADDAAATQTEEAEAFLEQPWHHESDALEAPLGARIGRELSIVSVGEATRADDHTVRVPLVLGDGDGETSTLVLSIRLDPLLDESPS